MARPEVRRRAGNKGNEVDLEAAPFGKSQSVRHGAEVYAPIETLLPGGEGVTELLAVVINEGVGYRLQVAGDNLIELVER